MFSAPQPQPSQKSAQSSMLPASWQKKAKPRRFLDMCPALNVQKNVGNLWFPQDFSGSSVHGKVIGKLPPPGMAMLVYEASN